MAIRGIHGMFYSDRADEVRAFLRDKLRLPFNDVGEGWLIFDLKEGDLGVHPTDTQGGPPSGTPHLSFYTDDVEATVRDLASRGVRCDPVADHGYGLVTYLTMPGGIRVELYQPRYQKRAAPKKRPAARAKAKPKPKAKAKSKARRR